jgi:hypothetical protein
MRFRRQDLRVESFEYVQVGTGLALLRLAGEWRADPPVGFRLLAIHGGVEEDLAPLPEPPGDGGGLWRAAFSAPGSVLEPRTRFVLEAVDGRTFELPLPVERGAVAAAPEPEPEPEPEPFPAPRSDPAAGPAPPPEPAVAPPARTGPSPDARAAEEALRTERGRYERLLRTERQRHERAEASLREQLRVMVSETAEFMGRLEGYEARRAELEKELSWERLLHKETRRLKDDAERERDEAMERLGPVEAELHSTRHEVDAGARASRRLVEARERIGELERRLDQQEDLLRNAREVLDRGTSRLVELEERLVKLRDEAEAAAVRETATPEQAHAVEEALEEADRGTERLAYLERRIGELREGMEAEPASTPGSAPAVIARPRPTKPPRSGRRRFLR